MPSLWQAIKNVIRGKSSQLAEKISDPIRDGKLAIEDSKKQIAVFTGKIAKLTAQTKLQIRKRDELLAEVNKYQSIAVRAAEMGNRDDARQAIEMRLSAENRFNRLNIEIEQNTQVLKNLRQGLGAARAKVANAQSNIVSLEARREGARIRTELAKASMDFSAGSSPLAALDNLEKAVLTEEANAEAWEELAQISHPAKALEEKYSGGSLSVEVELEKLMGPPEEQKLLE